MSFPVHSIMLVHIYILQARIGNYVMNFTRQELSDKNRHPPFTTVTLNANKIQICHDKHHEVFSGVKSH